LIGALMFSTVFFAQAAQQPRAAEAKPAPRTADGKPDLSGTWAGGGQAVGGMLASQTSGQGLGNLEVTKWGQEKFTWNRGPESANAPGVYGGQIVRLEYDPAYHCYPLGLIRLGPPMYMISGGSANAPATMEIIQTPTKVIIIHEYRNSIRYIYTDGRKHPNNPELTWNGHSIGKWEGDTLVVDTVGFRDESWLDTGGHEHSTELHVVERFRRVNNDTLEIERTLIDPIAIAKPFVSRTSVRLRPEIDLDENMDGRQFDCTQFMVRKPGFGEGENTLLGIGEPTTGPY
jgi:hypothetical protein